MAVSTPVEAGFLASSGTTAIVLSAAAGGIPAGALGIIVTCAKVASGALTVSSIGESRGNSWVRVGSSLNSTTSEVTEVWSAPIVTAYIAGDTFGVSFSATLTAGVAAVYYVTGAAAIDQIAFSTGTSTAPNTGATAALASTSDMAFAVCASSNAASTATFTPVAGYTALTKRVYTTLPGPTLFPYYQALSANTGVTFSGTLNASLPWESMVITIQPGTLIVPPHIALVGTIGAVTTGASAAAITPAWGAGESRTAGNLLVLWLGCNQSGIAVVTPSGWSIAHQTTGGAVSSTTIYYKIAAGADAAPTVAGVTGGILHGQLAEFSGTASAPLDGHAGANGTASPLVSTNAAVDATIGELMVSCSIADYSTAATKTLTDTYTNATPTATNDAATSTISHYDFAYGITTANAVADKNSFAFTTTKIGMASSALASFKVQSGPPVDVGTITMAGTAGMTVAGSRITKIRNLTDNFNTAGTPDTTKWILQGVFGGATIANSGGQCVFTIPASNNSSPGLQAGSGGSRDFFDVTEGAVVVQATAVGDSGTSAGLCSFQPIYLQDAGSTNSANFNIVSGNISAQIGFTTQGSSIAYNATNHQWFRIREHAGTMYWDLSPDGSTWTNLASAADIPNINAMNVAATANGGSGPTQQTFAIDNFNLPPPVTGAVAHSATAGMTIGGTRVVPAATALAATAGMTVAGTTTAGAVATYIFDTFTGANSTTLAAHTPDIGGAWSGTSVTIQSNRAQANNFQVPTHFDNATQAGSADFDISVDVVMFGGSVGQDQVGVAGRGLPGAGNFYAAYYTGNYGGTAQQVTLSKFVSAGETVLGSYSLAYVSGQTHNIKMRCQGSTISALVDGVTQISVTDTTYTSGTALCLWIGSGSPTSLAADNFRATSVSTGVTGVGTLTFAGSGTATVSGGTPVVTFDAVGPGSGGQIDNSAPSSLTWAHTCTGLNGLLVVVADYNSSNDTGVTMSATYNGVAMISQGIVHSGGPSVNVGFVQMWTMVGPPTGSHSVVVTATAASHGMLGGSVSLNGVNQTTPIRNFTSAGLDGGANDGTGPGLTSTSMTIASAIGNMVVAGCCYGSGTPSSTQTMRWSGNEGDTYAAANSGGEATATGASSVVMGWSGPALDFWGLVGLDVAVAAAPPPSVPAVVAGVLGAPVGFFVLGKPLAVPAQAGAVSMAATAGMTAVGTAPVAAAVTESATAGLTVAGTAVGVATVAESATAALMVAAVVTEQAVVVESATSTLTVAGIRTVPAVVALAASAGLTVGAVVATSAVVAESATAGMTIAASATEVAAVTESATAGMTVAGTVSNLGSVVETATAGMTVAATVPTGASVTESATAGMTVAAGTVQIQTGTVSLSASSGLTVAGLQVVAGAVSESATAGLTVGAVAATSASVAESANAGMTIAASATQVAAVTETATAGLSVAAAAPVIAAVTETATAGLTVAGAAASVAGVALAGTAGLTVAAAVPVPGGVPLLATASLTVAAAVPVPGVVALQATAGMTVAASATAVATVSLSGAAGMVVAASVLEQAVVAQSATAGLVVAASVTEIASITETATAGLTVSALAGAGSTAVMSAAAGMTIAAAVTQVAATTLVATAGMTVGGIVERPAAAALTASAGLTVGASATQVAVIAESATASLTVSAVAGAGSSTSLSAVAGLTVAASVTEIAAVAESATAGMVIAASVTEVATVAMSAGAGLTVDSTRVVPGVVNLAADAGMTLAASVTQVAVVTESASTSLLVASTPTLFGVVVQTATAGMTIAAAATQVATVSLTAVAGMTVAAQGAAVVAVNYSASASLTVAAAVTEMASVALAATTDMVISTAGLATASVLLPATTSVVVAATVAELGVVSLAAAAGLVVAATVTELAAVSLVATSGLSVTSVVTGFGVVVELAAAGELVVGTVTAVASVNMTATAGMTATGITAGSQSILMSVTAGMTVTAATMAITGAVAMSATATVSVTGVVTGLAVVAMTATASMAVVGVPARLGVVNMTALASMAPVGVLVTEVASVVMVATTSVSVAGIDIAVASVALAASTALFVVPGAVRFASVLLSATTTMALVPQGLGFTILTGETTLTVSASVTELAMVLLVALAHLSLAGKVRGQGFWGVPIGA